MRWGRAALAAALTTLVAGCGGSGGDKAGGHDAAVAKPVGKPVTLRLITVDDLWASEYAAAVARRSGGSIRIQTQLGGTAIVDYERRLVEKVRAGEYDLSSVGARAWDRLGVQSLRAFVAPLLIDSLRLERRALATPRAREALSGVGKLDLVGLALLPGPLRRPFGLTRPLLRPEHFEGATIGLRRGGVAEDTYRTFGATPKAYRVGSLAGLDGAELDLWTIGNNGYDQRGSTLTGNVVLWARPETIVIRRAAFDRLAPPQQDVLRRAAADAVGPVLARLQREQQNALVEICNRGATTVVESADGDVAALRAAVRPVYKRLERDPATRRLIAEIRALRGSGGGDVVRCPSGSTHAELLEGAWRSDVTGPELRASGGTPAEAAVFSGRATLELRAGRWTFRNDQTTVKGAYRVEGPVVVLTMRSCTVNPCSPGMVTEYGWSIYRDRLTLTQRPGRLFWPRLVAKSGDRVR
jgi:TRAP-type C4-dicarboxylate transport system substrate-binding protein